MYEGRMELQTRHAKETEQRDSSPKAEHYNWKYPH